MTQIKMNTTNIIKKSETKNDKFNDDWISNEDDNERTIRQSNLQFFF